MLINARQAGEILGVSHNRVRDNSDWLTIYHTPKGKQRYSVAEVISLANKWADDLEGKAAVIRSRVNTWKSNV